MAAKIKICGLKRPEDIQYVNEFKPDYVGFVFFPPSSRYVTVEQAKELSGMLDPEIIPVGVFLESSPEEILRIAQSGAVKVIQIHGATPELIRTLKAGTDLPVWEAIRVREEADLLRAEESPADMILLDHGAGGTGECFDWSLIHGLTRDFFLAGGISGENIREALSCNPYGVDVSSGAETNKIKDRDKIRELIRLVRSEEEI